MSNARKRCGAKICGRWYSPYKLHLYFGFPVTSERGFVYPMHNGIMLSPVEKRWAKESK